VSSYGFVKKSGGVGKLIVISEAVRCGPDIPGALRSGGLIECLERTYECTCGHSERIDMAIH
jgi:hypothetical protein